MAVNVNTGRRSARRLGARALAISVLSFLVAVGGPGITVSSASGLRPDGQSTTLTIMTSPVVWLGMTKKSSGGSNSIAAWYTYYHSIWAKDFPNVTIKEIEVPDDTTMVTKTLLGVESGNPPDLVAMHEQLPGLVERGALTNLTPYYKAAGITPSDMLAPLSNFARYGGQWYAMPGASSPTVNSLFYIPKFVQAAGISPNAVPSTWSGLMAASKKVVKFGPSHTLERVGEPVLLGTTDNESVAQFYSIGDLYCGYEAYWNAKTGYHLNAPCLLNFARYEQQLVNLYGGWSGYQKFISGDPGPWSCSPNDYSATGKILFEETFAYWDGVQFDRCYNLQWALGPPPTQSGTSTQQSQMFQTQWFVAIPRGAKNPQLAFDFWLKTVYDNGQLTGPTTNGYVRASTAGAWWKDLVSVEAQTRAAKHFSGNPIASFVPLETKEANLANGQFAKSTIGAFVDQQIGDAWNNVMYKHESVAKAFGAAQNLVVQQEHSQPGGVLATGVG
jgi:ABC-type glycerol-3-phosphate transport system substrate-binding protein